MANQVIDQFRPHNGRYGNRGAIFEFNVVDLLIDADLLRGQVINRCAGAFH